MLVLLAHSGHAHGPEPGLVALLVAAATLGTLLLVSLVRRRRT